MEIDPQVGGYYRLMIDSPEFSAMNEGSFLLVEPLHHTSYSRYWLGQLYSGGSQNISLTVIKRVGWGMSFLRRQLSSNPYL